MHLREVSMNFWFLLAAQEYDVADSGGPAAYLGYAGYVHIGRLLSRVARAIEFAGAL
jgi:hypothetical protein